MTLGLIQKTSVSKKKPLIISKTVSCFKCNTIQQANIDMNLSAKEEKHICIKCKKVLRWYNLFSVTIINS